MNSRAFAELCSRPRTCFDCGGAIEDAGRTLCSVCNDERLEIGRIISTVEIVRSAFDAGVPARYFFDARSIRPEGEQLELRGAIAKVLAGEAASPWLLITGRVGTGKSFAAARAVVHQLATRGSGAALFVSAPTFISGYTSSALDQREQFLSRYASAPFLVLDDLGSEKGTQHSADTLFALIDARSAAMLPLLITSNFGLHEIAGRLTGADDGMQARRIADRVRQMVSAFDLSGPSFRATAPAPAEWSRYLELIASIQRQLTDRFRPALAKCDDDIPPRKRVEPWQRDLAEFVQPALERDGSGER